MLSNINSDIIPFAASHIEHGLVFKDEVLALDANYLAKYIQKMKQEEGIAIDALYIKKEPLHPGE